jgi:hypothetical protein
MPYFVATANGLTMDISGNILRASGGLNIRQPFTVETTGYSAKKPFVFTLLGVNRAVQATVRAAGYTTAASVNPDQYACYEVRATFQRVNAGTLSKIGNTKVLAERSFTNNQNPVDFVMLTGPTWTTSMSLALGDVVVNSAGNAYLVILSDGTGGATEPTVTSGAWADAGVRYQYLGAEAATSVAVIVGGETNMNFRWSGEIHMLVTQ